MDFLGIACNKVQHAISIKFSNIEAAVYTDNLPELAAIRDYINGVWVISELDLNTYQDSDNIWRIYSFIHNCNNYVEQLQFRSKKLYDKNGGWQAEDSNGNVLIFHKNKDAGLTVFNKELKCIFFIRRTNFIDIIHVSQFIKEPFKLSSRFNGFFNVHCSACIYNGKGIIMAANKGSGKSTLLMHLLALGAKFVGNDTVRIYLTEDNKLEMIAWPHFIRLGEGTISDNTRLKKYFDELNSNNSSNEYFFVGNDKKNNSMRRKSIIFLKQI